MPSVPDRRTRNGLAVNTHEQFCDYLVEMDPAAADEPPQLGRIQLGALEGRSTVIYSVPVS